MRHSEACERNKRVILEVLAALLPQCSTVLEIGSGTAQHAVHFTKQMPGLRWQCSDLAENLPGIQARVDLEGDDLLPNPIELNVLTANWPAGRFDAVFTANTLHIMPWDHTLVLLDQVVKVLVPGGRLIIYGPFHDSGIHTAASNAAFDRSLKSRDPDMGVRDAVEITAQAARRGLHAEADLALPANNRTLIFRQASSIPQKT
ncbi:DUF938 domain-containing protein [Wenzhouxiangella limi]|uniref:DUF938 domain-containing protein n=1 Tax=Wenzhouxiangella limi TaxID=2707351 RepID=A0A845V1B3_9GAMM|nr:DUF938 domain-containing protein [Wenzhouxiangella limi]NDY96010.1 DUF938 domain-containing protein [Wenzhouxiangella limi]